MTAVRHIEGEGCCRELGLSCNAKLHGTFLNGSNGCYGNSRARLCLHIDSFQVHWSPAEGIVRFQDDLVLVCLGEDGGYEPLPQRAVEGIVYVRHADAKAACRIAVDVDIDHGAGRQHVRSHVTDFRTG